MTWPVAKQGCHPSALAKTNHPSGVDCSIIGKQSLPGVSKISWGSMVHPHRRPAGWVHRPWPLGGTCWRWVEVAAGLSHCTCRRYRMHKLFPSCRACSPLGSPFSKIWRSFHGLTPIFLPNILSRRCSLPHLYLHKGNAILKHWDKTK